MSDSELEQLKAYAQKQNVNASKVEAAYLALGNYRNYINQRAITFNKSFFDESELSPVSLFMMDTIEAFAEFEHDRLTEGRAEDMNKAHKKYMDNLVKKAERAANSASKSLSMKKLAEFLDADVFQAEAPRKIERLKAGLPETAGEIVSLIKSVRSQRITFSGKVFIESVVSSLKWWADIDMPSIDSSLPNSGSHNQFKRNEHPLVSMFKVFNPITGGDHYQTVYHCQKYRQYEAVTKNHIGSKFIKPRATTNTPIEKRR
ncbi:hypothetical protein CWO23_00970 [Vibrio splendidus]|uniref:hypothetical protein n=1 Tax=Vibrio splendidus TaxID=29497 RepID=UPI000D3A8A03|nr:hypothetical protein [Vibrio splendidus]PTP77625.1 hypothetical protein CWO23_00970 [Vibrio splendidus]